MTFKFLNLLFVAAILPAARLNAADSFRFTNTTDKSLALFEGDRPVFVYNHGVIKPPAGVPASWPLALLVWRRMRPALDARRVSRPPS